MNSRSTAVCVCVCVRIIVYVGGNPVLLWYYSLGYQVSICHGDNNTHDSNNWVKRPPLPCCHACSLCVWVPSAQPINLWIKSVIFLHDELQYVASVQSLSNYFFLSMERQVPTWWLVCCTVSYTIYTQQYVDTPSNDWIGAISATPIADWCIQFGTQPCTFHRQTLAVIWPY